MVNSHIISSYAPLNDSQYMSDLMLNYFKETLQKMQKQVLEAEETIFLSLTSSANREPDFLDRGVYEEQHSESFMLQEHEGRLLQEIELALKRIKDGCYGYCEETGKPIGVKRLLAIPYARYCLKTQEYQEHKKKKLSMG